MGITISVHRERSASGAPPTPPAPPTLPPPPAPPAPPSAQDAPAVDRFAELRAVVGRREFDEAHLRDAKAAMRRCPEYFDHYAFGQLDALVEVNGLGGHVSRRVFRRAIGAASDRLRSMDRWGDQWVDP